MNPFIPSFNANLSYLFSDGLNVSNSVLLYELTNLPFMDVSQYEVAVALSGLNSSFTGTDKIPLKFVE